MIVVTAKQAVEICKRLGLSYEDGQKTFWAYDEEDDEIYDFDSRTERDFFVKLNTPKAE